MKYYCRSIRILLQNLESSQNDTDGNQKKQNLKVGPMLLLQQPVDTEHQSQRQHVWKDLVEGILELDCLDNVLAVEQDVLGERDGCRDTQDARNEATHNKQGRCTGHVGDTGDSSAADLPYKTDTLLVTKPEPGEHHVEPDEAKEQHEPRTGGMTLKGQRRCKHGEDRLHQNSLDGITDACKGTHQGNLQAIADLRLSLLLKSAVGTENCR